MAEQGSTSAQRAIDVLLALGSATSPDTQLGVVDIARVVGREKSQVSRTLRLLAESGLVDRDPDTLRYRLGWRLFTLAAAAGDQRLLAASPPVLRRLVDVVGESAHLTVLEGRAVLTVWSESPPKTIHATSWVGRMTPVHCSSSGRALLFDLTQDEITALIGDGPMSTPGPNAPRGLAEVVERLAVARRRGYALVDEEFEPGLVAAAAPVRDFRGRVVAAVNMSAPKFRLGTRLDATGRQVKAAADHLSAQLGWTAAPASAGTPGNRASARGERCSPPTHD